MLKSSGGTVPVYTLAGSNTARPLPDWLQRKRKRSLKHDPEFAHRVELLQDYSFKEASICTRVSEDGAWVVSTGTYKPQMHIHSLSNLSLSYARHTDTINHTFILLSSDYSKSLHLQTDRSLEFHTPAKLHHTSRLPRYGRDLKYSRWNTEALVPAVGVNESGMGEVFRLNLEQGKFMKSYEVDVGGDDYASLGGGALQGGINTGAVNCAAVAENSHNLVAFGTSTGTIEFFDPRVRSRVGILTVPGISTHSLAGTAEGRGIITALEFHPSGLTLAAGSGSGIIQLYDLRNPLPFWQRDQGYGYAIKNLIFINPTSHNERQKLMSADTRIIKLWDIDEASSEGSDAKDRKQLAPWTSIEPAVDINHVEYVPKSGMFLTANEGGPQHIFFIPALGPAPSWCRFIDNLVEEMAEDRGMKENVGQIYDNFKFLTPQELRDLSMDHLIGQSKAAKILRPYMHGYFVDQKLYEQARLISNPSLFTEARVKSIQEKIQKERESRIRGMKPVKVKVNKALAQRMTAKDENFEARKARQQQVLIKDEVTPNTGDNNEVLSRALYTRRGLLTDPRFSKLFEDEDFEIDEASGAFAAINPSTKPRKSTGLTNVEQEELEDDQGSRHELSSSESEPNTRKRSTFRITAANYRKNGQKSRYELKNQRQPNVVMSTSSAHLPRPSHRPNKTFGSRVALLQTQNKYPSMAVGGSNAVGEKSVTFNPLSPKSVKKDPSRSKEYKHDRRSASGNVFRNL